MARQASALYRLTDNAIIYFEKGTGIVVDDPDTGNPVETMEILEVRASIKQRSRFMERDKHEIGKESAEQIVVGSLVKPPVIGLRQVARKDPVRVVVNGQPGVLVIDTIIDSPAITRLRLTSLVGEQFTGRLIYDP
jgi:hypothetical protein